MKVNIQKLQAGGGIPTYRPLPIIPSTPSAPVTQSTGEAPIKEDVLDKMIGKGITSDVMVYADQIKNAYSTYASLPETIRNSPEGQMLRQQMKGDWAKLNALERSKDRFDKILDNRKEAMPEMAVYQGKVIAHDRETGGLVSVSFQDYANSIKGDKKYKALTNSELAYIRENDSKYAGKNEMFNILENSRSTEEVTKEIRGVLQDLGSFARGEADVSYEEKQVGEGASNLLNKGMSYVRTSEGDFIQSNRQNIKMAANAMWANLKENSKDLLRAKAAAYGYTPDQIEEAAMGLAVSLLDPPTKEIIKMNRGETPGKGAGSKDVEGKGGIWQQAAALQTPHEQIQLNLGSNKSAVMTGWRLDNLAKQTGEWRKSDFVTEIPEIESIADPAQGVYIGDQYVKQENLDALLWDGHKGYVVFMPVKYDEKNDKYMPDVAATERLEEAKKEITKLGKTTPLSVKKEIYYKHGFTDLDNKGEPVVGRVVQPFLTFQGTINSSLVDNPRSSSLHILDSDQQEFYDTRYRYNEKGKKVDRPGYQWYWANADAVKSTVFIPMKLGAPYTAQLMEQKSVGIPKEQTTSAYYDREGFPYKQDPKKGVARNIIGTSTKDLE